KAGFAAIGDVAVATRVAPTVGIRDDAIRRWTHVRRSVARSPPAQKNADPKARVFVPLDPTGAQPSPITSTPLPGAYLNVFAGKLGLRFKPEKLISVFWPSASTISILLRAPPLKPRRALRKLASPGFLGVSNNQFRPPSPPSSLTANIASSLLGSISAASGL